MMKTVVLLNSFLKSEIKKILDSLINRKFIIAFILNKIAYYKCLYCHF